MLNHNLRMLARLCAFFIWALVAATAVFWGLRLIVRAPAAPAYALAVGDASAERGDLTRLLGTSAITAPAAAAAPEAGARFRLFGIVAPKYAGGSVPDAHGVALIAVDGKMPRAYRVGSRLDGDLVLRSVSLRSVSIGSTRGSSALTLELPPLAAAATGTLPAPDAVDAHPAPARMTVPQYVPKDFTPPVMLPAASQALSNQAVPPSALVPRPESNAPAQ